MNPGKILEKQWKQSSENQHIFIYRIKDTDNSFDSTKQKMNNTQFSTPNPCDYLQFHKGLLLPLELKSTCGKSVSFEREPKSGGLIKFHQITSLKNFSEYEGVYPGFILEFREEDDLKNVLDVHTYFIYIQNFLDFMAETDKNSINKLDIIDHGGIIIESKKLRKHFLYNIKKLFDTIVEKQWLDSKD